MSDVTSKKRYNPNVFNALDGGVAYIAAILAFFIAGFLLPYLFRPLLRAGVDYFLVNILSAVISQAIIFFIAFIFFKVKRVGVFSGDGYSFKLNAIDALMAVMLIFGIDFCFTSLHTDFFGYMEALFGDLGFTIPEEIIKNSNPLYILIYSLVITPVLPAICEEMLFRGVIMRGFKERGVPFSIFLSAICFALMHGSVAMFILQFLAGLTIAAVVSLTKNHLYGSIMHWASNLFITLYALAPSVLATFSVALSAVAQAFQALFGLAFLLISGYYFLNKLLAKKKREILGTEKSKNFGEKYVAECFIASSGEVVLKNFDEDFEVIKKDKDNMFKCGDKFVRFNKKSNAIVSLAVLAAGLIFAVVSLFV